LLWPTVITLLGVVLTATLGTWQLQRRAWKADLIAQRTAAVAATPVALPQALAPSAGYLRTTVTGRFDHARELYLTGRAYRDQPGLHVLTPLVLADGSGVLVDRGWVPNSRRDPASRAQGQVAGEVTVTGLARLGVERGWMQPENQPAQNLWFYLDIAALTTAAGVPRLRPFLIEADATPQPGGLPIGGQSRIDLPNNHLQYALTWYSFGVTLAVIYGLWLRRRLRDLA
jgi:surfeit locus 1 family protein